MIMGSFKKISHNLKNLSSGTKLFSFFSTSYSSCIELSIMFYIFMPPFLGNEKEKGIVSLQRIRGLSEVSRWAPGAN
jgi:hypothetical protein